MSSRWITRQADVFAEVVAGLLWMHLSLPSDVSRDELESCAADLIRAVEFGGGESAVEQKLKQLQSDQLGQPVNGLAIKLLVRRVCEVVRRRAASAPLQQFPGMKKAG
jgi:hypothetical protein